MKFLKTNLQSFIFPILLSLCSSCTILWGATNFACDFSSFGLVAVLLCTLLIQGHFYISRKKLQLGIFPAILCLFFSVLWLFIESFHPENAFVFSKPSVSSAFLVIVYFIGSMHILFMLGKLIYVFFHQKTAVSFPLGHRIYALSYGKTALLLFLCYFLHLLLAFPGAMCIDTDIQFAQFLGKLPFTAHHPPIHTLLLGGTIRLGTWLSLGHQVFGFFLFVLLQAVVLSLVCAYLLSSMKKLHASSAAVFLTFLFFVTSPIFTSYVSTLLKDCLYAYCFLLYMIELLWLVVLKQEYWQKASHKILYILSVMGVYLFRNNGKYVILFTTLFYLVFLLRKDLVPQKRPKAFIYLVLPIVLSLLINGCAMRMFSIEKGSIREMLSLPFQQTARYVRDHEAEVTPEEKEIIDRVLVYDALADTYDPLISDPVKDRYKEPPLSDLWAYFGVWLKQGIQHPSTYFAATIEQNASLFYPHANNAHFFRSAIADSHPVLKVVADVRAGLYQWLNQLPGLGLVSNPWIWNTVLLFLCAFGIKKKHMRFLFVCTPLLLSLLIIIVSPCIMHHIRYAFPILYSGPIVFAYYKTLSA